jgi:Bifunctional DNA primase/polymerase, N-terminal/AAA domain/Primase C terminal 1 (PriCT-1)
VTALLEAARAYRQRGLSVIPVGSDKRPLIEWRAYQTEAPHPDEIDVWWEREPDANIGVVTGRVSGLVVLDADGPEGLESLKALKTPSTTWISRTGRGWHQWFAHPGSFVGNRAGVRPHLDVRGDGGYVVAPPSLHPSGKRYEWLTGPDDIALASLPSHVLELLVAGPAPTPPGDGDVIPEGQRQERLYRLGRALAAKGMSSEAIAAALLEENRQRCRPPLSEREILDTAHHVTTQLHRPDFAPAARPTVDDATAPWALYDAADAWTFAPVAFTVDSLLPAAGVVWWGGPPKRYKSLLCVYTCLAIASGCESVAEHFTIRQRPRILYVAREDGGSRLQGRRDDILNAWPHRPAPGALRFVIRPRLDLLNAAHVAWLRETCQREGVTLLVLDTWTTLSPTADPMSAVDQTHLAAVVVELAEAIGGTVVVVDHSRKNRADDQPISSADIYGPLQKWATAEHICMFDLTADRRRLELFVEGKDGDTRRLFLTITPKGAPGEKFSYAGTVEDIADAQRAKGDQNRDAVHRILVDAGAGLTPKDVHAGAKARGLTIGEETVSKHLRALAKAGRADVIGKGPSTRYVGIAPTPSDAITVRDSELFVGTRS